MGAPSPAALAPDLNVLNVHDEHIAGLVAEHPLWRGSSSEVDELVLDVPPACSRHPITILTRSKLWRNACAYFACIVATSVARTRTICRHFTGGISSPGNAAVAPMSFS